MTDTTEDRMGLGGNLPPEEDTIEDFEARIKARVADFEERSRDQIVGLYKALPEEIDAGNEGLISDFLGQTAGLIKDAEKLHKELKDPWWKRCNIVDAVIGKKSKAYTWLTRLHDEVKRKQSVYMAEKTRREQEAKAAALKKAQEEEARQRAEAERKEREAAEAARKAKTDRERAEARLKVAEAQEAEAAAKVEADRVKDAERAQKERTKVKGAYGTTSFTKTVTKFEVVDEAALPVALLWSYVSPEERHRAIRKAIEDGMSEIRGVRIFEEIQTINRRAS